MKQPSLFYQASQAMFLMACAIMGAVLLSTLVGRLLGGSTSDPGAIYGVRTASKAMVASALGSVEQGKLLEHSFAAIYSPEYESVSITQIKEDRSPIGFFCGTVQSHGYSVVNGIVYNGTAYSLYYPFDESTGMFSESLVAMTLNLTTGEAAVDVPPENLPSQITDLSEDQLYGIDPLPPNMTYMDKAWYESLTGPDSAIVTSEDCMGVVLGNLGAVVLFGIVFGAAWLFRKKPSL